MFNLLGEVGMLNVEAMLFSRVIKGAPGYILGDTSLRWQKDLIGAKALPVALSPPDHLSRAL